MNATIYHGKELEYSDVLLVPQESDLSSRSDADTRITIGDFDFQLPVVPANMETVIDLEVAKKLDDAGYFYVMHRFDDIFKTLQYMHHNEFRCKSISVGVNQDTYDALDKILDTGNFIDIVTVDVAHGHHVKAENMVRYIKSRFPEATIIAGNVGTYEGFKYLEDAGADIVKVGIGSGVICTTRYKTGFGTPMFSTIQKIVHKSNKAKIMADGGCKHFGDIAKAFAAGADMVMAGSFFASCIDSPAKLVNGVKQYYGSTSFAQKQNRLNFVEGKEVELNLGPDYVTRLHEIKCALQSSISYAGGQNLSCLKKVEYITL
jgi:GMP reductase